MCVTPTISGELVALEIQESELILALWHPLKRSISLWTVRIIENSLCWTIYYLFRS